MGWQMVGPKLVRRIARETQQDVVRAWGHGTYGFDFVTDHHEHGWWDKKTGEWGWTNERDVVHPTSCREKPWSDVFTGDPVPIAERDQPLTTYKTYVDRYFDLPLHRAGDASVVARCGTCDGGGCLDCTDPA